MTSKAELDRVEAQLAAALERGRALLRAGVPLILPRPTEPIGCAVPEDVRSFVYEAQR